MPHIAPSILSADFLRLGDTIRLLEKADSLHLDVMDGHFVPNITFGADLVAQLRGMTMLPLDVHLMIANPEDHIDRFIDAGASSITVHQEVCVHLHRTLHAIRGRGVDASVALNPSTPLETVRWILEDVQQILIMTVNPGFGGQAFIDGMLPKIEQLAEWKQRGGYGFRIQVDGGVNEETLPKVVDAGAEVVVIGSALFTGKHGAPDEALAFFRNLAARGQNKGSG